MVRSQTDEKLLIGCIYRSPNSNVTNDAKINDTLKKANILGFSHVLIFGDLNHPSLNWRDNTSPPDGNHQFFKHHLHGRCPGILPDRECDRAHYRGNNTSPLTTEETTRAHSLQRKQHEPTHYRGNNTSPLTTEETTRAHSLQRKQHEPTHYRGNNTSPLTIEETTHQTHSI